MRPAPLPMEEMEWRQTPPPITTAPGTFRLRRGSRFTWRKECLAVMERWRGGGVGVLLITNRSLLHNTSLISSRSWENIAVWPEKTVEGATSLWLLSRRNIGPGRAAHIPNSSAAALLTSSSHGEINLISVTLLLFIATSTTTSTQTRPNGRR